MEKFSLGDPVRGRSDVLCAEVEGFVVGFGASGEQLVIGTAYAKFDAHEASGRKADAFFREYNAIVTGDESEFELAADLGLDLLPEPDAEPETDPAPPTEPPTVPEPTSESEGVAQ